MIGVLKKMKTLPKSIVLIGERSPSDFVESIFPRILASDLLTVHRLTNEILASISSFYVLSPKGEHRVVLVQNADLSRRDVQATLLKLIEDSPDRTHWILSILSRDRILPPILSRSFSLDWGVTKRASREFTEKLTEILANPDYLAIFKLHNTIADEAGSDTETMKQLHMKCLSEMSLLMPSPKASPILKAQNQMRYSQKTEIIFKTALIEALL